MPHIPRMFSSTGPRPELNFQTRSTGQPKSSVAYQPTSKASPLTAGQEQPPRQNMVDRLSIRKFDVDPNRVFEQLMGKEAQIDEHSGELV